MFQDLVESTDRDVQEGIGHVLSTNSELDFGIELDDDSVALKSRPQAGFVFSNDEPIG